MTVLGEFGSHHRPAALGGDRKQHLVLVVDDDPMTRELLRDVIEGMGCAVLEVGDGREAREVLRRVRPSVILLDIQLPHADGFEVLHQIRTEAGIRDTPVIATTAYASGGDQHRARREGFDAFLAKPIRVGKLREVLREFLRGGRRNTDTTN